MKSPERLIYFTPVSSSLRMSSDSSPEKPIAIWNPARGVWETSQPSLFCEHWEAYSETFPRSGTMRNGRLFELPTWVPPTEGRESSSLLGTPTSRDYKGIPGKNVQMASLPRDVSLLPTPNTMDDLPPKTREQIKAHRDEGRGGDRNLREYVLYDLQDAPEDRWGKYEPAIRSWEKVLQRPAPEPTEPTGRDGAQRLSPKFTEWIMGLPEGWVTGTGVSYKGQLHTLGNGVVPQQAELALRILLGEMHGD
jgi:hypothetical protein